MLLSFAGAGQPTDGSSVVLLLGGLFTLLGVLLGIGGSLATERLRGRTAERNERANALRVACASFSSNLVRTSHLSSRLRGDPGDADVIARLQTLHEEGRAAFELLRLLSDSIALQEAGRMALRHVFAVWQVASGEVDHRASEFPGRTPRERFGEQLDLFYVEARKELRLAHPESVFLEPAT